MPTRLVREGILESERIGRLSAGAELFYRKLMSIVDDYGRFELHPKILLGRLYLFQIDDIKPDQIIEWAEECANVHSSCEAPSEPLILIYKRGSKSFVQINGFGQRARSESKFPAPGDEDLSPKDQMGSVYFVLAPISNKIKIGFTQHSNPKWRLAGLQTNSSEKLELAGFVAGPRKLEREYHLKFAHSRLNGEWFEYTDEIKSLVQSLAIVGSCVQMRADASRASNTNTNTHPNTNIPEGGTGETASATVPPKAPTPIRPPVAKLTDEEWNAPSADDVARKLVAMIHPNHPEPCYADSAIIECARALIDEVPEPLWEETAKRWRENHALQVSIWEEKRAKTPGIYVPRLDEWFTKRMCNQRPKARDSPASANDIARQQALARQAAKRQAEAGL